MLHEKTSQSASPYRRGRQDTRRRQGFTLLEVLIATAVTLLMMVSLAQIFKSIGDSMKQGRAALELNNRLRSVALRIRNDLENLTVVPNPPVTPKSGTGYLKLFDGSLTDYSGSQFVSTTSPNLSRFGDIDDIFMATARAGDVPFKGKVPRFLLRNDVAADYIPDLVTDSDGDGIADDLEPVTIESQHAEIVIFAEPVVASSRTDIPGIVNVARNPVFMVSNPAFFQDDDANGVPDAYRLHYRVLLIRPDLNRNIGRLRANLATGLFLAGPKTLRLPDGSSSSLKSPFFDMAPIHSICDLSVRRIIDDADGLSGSNDYIAANSLEDLMNPSNRFAHIHASVSTSNSTMPLLALGPANSALYTAGTEPNGVLAGPGFDVGSSFLHPAYSIQDVRSFYDLAAPPPSRVGEDVLASNVLSFDIKGFDPGVPLLPSPGVDGAPGLMGIDDDGDGTNDNISELGWAGSDDLVLSPNDPGYASQLGATPIGSGEFVDVGWARKIIVPFMAAGGTVPAGANLWSQLSGYSQSNVAASSINGTPFTNALYKSGLIVQNSTLSSSPPRVMQPSFDSWTTRFEGDGVRQTELNGGRGTVFGTGTPRESWRAGLIDPATDGLDNNGANGVDDMNEMETSPPFPYRLPGLRISIRMEDPATRTVKQMSVAKEFVTQ